MTIEELEAVCRNARESGLDGLHEVKLYHKFDIVPVADSQVRKVQIYESDGADHRNKYLLLSSVDISGLSSK